MNEAPVHTPGLEEIYCGFLTPCMMMLQVRDLSRERDLLHVEIHQEQAQRKNESQVG